MNATIEDPRLPGGTATGKITSYSLTGNGDSGAFLTKIKIGCAVGTSGTVSSVAGTGVYAESGVFASGVQQMTDSTVVISSSDVGYGPPLDNPNDDGLVFPLTAEQIILSQSVVGSIAAQEAAINAALPTIKAEAALQQRTAPSDANAQVRMQQQMAAYGNVTIDSVLAQAGNSIYLDLQLSALTGAGFTTVYNVATTKLQIPKQIDLGA
jgi:hypothetical protein